MYKCFSKCNYNAVFINLSTEPSGFARGPQVRHLQTHLFVLESLSAHTDEDRRQKMSNPVTVVLTITPTLSQIPTSLSDCPLSLSLPSLLSLSLPLSVTSSCSNLRRKHEYARRLMNSLAQLHSREITEYSNNMLLYGVI